MNQQIEPASTLAFAESSPSGVENVHDFSRAFLRFTSNRIQNTARLQLDALCALTDQATGQATRYALTAPCIAENMYRDQGLIQVPSCEFRLIASEKEYRILKSYPTHDLDVDIARQKDAIHTTFDGRKAQFTELVIHTPETEAREVRGYDEFREAFLGNRHFIGVTELASPDGALAARMEYPIRTSNILESRKRWQVDAGPVIWPDFSRKVGLRVEHFARAYIVFNELTWAEIIPHQPAPVMNDGQAVAVTSHYNAPRRIGATSRIYAVES